MAVLDLPLQDISICGFRKTVSEVRAAHGAVFVVEGDETERLPTAFRAYLIVILHFSSLHLG